MEYSMAVRYTNAELEIGICRSACIYQILVIGRCIRCLLDKPMHNENYLYAVVLALR